jgi:hypothetical protein
MRVRGISAKDWPIELGCLGCLYLIQRVFRSDALGGIASEAVDEAIEYIRRGDVLIHGLSHRIATDRRQRVLLDREHIHLDIATAIRGRHDRRSRGAATAAKAEDVVVFAGGR